MVRFSFLLIFLAHFSLAQNTTRWSPMTMEQLMDYHRLKGGNFLFRFKKPVYAAVRMRHTAYREGEKVWKCGSVEVWKWPEREEVLMTQEASKNVFLYFRLDKEQVIGRSTVNNEVLHAEREMLINLRHREDLEHGRYLRYPAKFATTSEMKKKGGCIDFLPALPAVPQLNREYLLNYYGKEGDDYHAMVVIMFVEDLKDLSAVKKASFKDDNIAGERAKMLPF